MVGSCNRRQGMGDVNSAVNPFSSRTWQLHIALSQFRVEETAVGYVCIVSMCK